MVSISFGNPPNSKDNLENQENPEEDPNYVGANLFGGLWSGICGTANNVGSGTQNRIVGGFETQEHQYPWMVRFFSKLPEVISK